MNQDPMTLQEEIEVAAPSLAAGELVIGSISGLDDSGEPLVDFALNTAGHSLKAISTLAVTRQHVGRKAALMFKQGDLSSPIIIGLVYSPLQEMIENFELRSAQVDNEEQVAPARHEAEVDGDRLVLEGKEEIVLKCGESSISLHKSGKIMIRGKYLLNRATGVNRILGGSVQVN
jgi:hypothetical protein